MKGSKEDGTDNRTYDSFKLLNEVMTTNMSVEYADVFDGGLGIPPGQGTPSHGRGCKTCTVSCQKSASYTQAKVEKEVICPIVEPTEWCNQISVQMKKDMSLQVCIDPRPLNKILQLEFTHSQQWMGCCQIYQQQNHVKGRPTIGVLAL